MNPGDSQGGGQGLGVVVVVVVVVVVGVRGGSGVVNGNVVELKGVFGGMVVLRDGASVDVRDGGLIPGGVGGIGEGTKHSKTSGQLSS